jgi:peptidoglycan hydrolase-like protein with peptidoglycan-binding domain
MTKRFANTLGLAVAMALVFTTIAAANGGAVSPAHKKTRKHHYHSEPKQKAPTADRITEIQSALARNGYYQGDPTGKMDSSTVAALQKFQSANGMEGSGKLDAPTLQKLGLGSDIAGVSAPRPVLPPSASPAVAAPGPSPRTSNPPAAISGSISASNSQATQPEAGEAH